MVALRSHVHPHDDVAVSFSVRKGAVAGSVAALVMLAVQLGWRVLSDTGAPAFPEQIVTAIARLTPLDLFGEITETYGGTAKRVLFVAVLCGIVAVGALAGVAATWLSRRIAQSGQSQGVAPWIAGAIVALTLVLIVGLVVHPIGHYGIFATDSQYSGQMQFQLAVTFALWVAMWALRVTSGRAHLATQSDEKPTTRRAVFGAPLTLLGLLGTGVFAWRLIAPKSADTTESREAAEQITQRAQGVTPEPSAAVAGVAEVATPAVDESAKVALETLDVEGYATPLVTSIADFYSVSKNIVDPTVSADGWSLHINGLVYNEASFTLDELRAMATTLQLSTLCCISNELNGRLISTAEWQGVPLVQLLAQVGAMPEVVDLRLLAADDYEDSIPLSAALATETMIVVGMNGEPLPDKNGFPARLIVPGIYGMKNVKWLQEITLVDEDFKGFWQTRGWSDPAPTQIWGRVDWPPSGYTVPAGTVTIAGVASAVKRGISRVEVSTDNGETWADAYLEPSLNGGLTWRRWAITPELGPGEYTVRVRATDGSGTPAPQQENPPLPAGATGWPRRRFNVE